MKAIVQDLFYNEEIVIDFKKIDTGLSEPELIEEIQTFAFKVMGEWTMRRDKRFKITLK